MPKAETTSEETKEWDVFVCYAWEDQEEVARPLATFLRDLGLRVWYDEMELRVGDPLRRKVDAGLTRCKFGVVILSESFFGKHYPESELDGLAQREQDGQDLILPVWHDVDAEDVRRHSPRLADRVALKWQDGISVVVTGLLRVIAPDVLQQAITHVQELAEDLQKAEVARITTGAELAELLGRCAFFFFKDEPRDEDVSLIGGFQQDLTDWSDIWDELGPLQRAEAASQLSEQLEELRVQGWTVHGRPEELQRTIRGELVDWPMATVVVVRGEPSCVLHLGNGRIQIIREDGESLTGK